MIKYEAIGIVEAKHFTTALEILDAMCKASDVTFLSSEKKLGGRLVTTIVGGSISNVNAAIEAARLVCQGREELIKGALVISRPHEEIMKFIVKDDDGAKAIEEKKIEITKDNRVVEREEVQIAEDKSEDKNADKIKENVEIDAKSKETVKSRRRKNKGGVKT
ncbi:BMC domain-containing protein [Clostridium bovifaecis]|uniref:BMC domain-containing protein n=1 Tax=Clostridium bovifaecis TaxID=2184719 RepID=A0A6I6F1S4_9CLOT|nr:BMC domain-containing protein [Clostridium bovifaecis]